MYPGAGQSQEQQHKKGHHRQRRRQVAVCTSRVRLQHTNEEHSIDRFTEASIGQIQDEVTRVGSKKHDRSPEKTPLVTPDRRGPERRFPIGLPSSVGGFGLAALASSGVLHQELDAWITRERWLW